MLLLFVSQTAFFSCMTYIYIYIYIYREREIYIYTYVYTPWAPPAGTIRPLRVMQEILAAGARRRGEGRPKRKRFRNKMLPGPYKAPKGTNTKVTSAKGPHRTQIYEFELFELIQTWCSLRKRTHVRPISELPSRFQRVWLQSTRQDSRASPEVRLSICMLIYMYIYIYTYIHTHTHTHIDR